MNVSPDEVTSSRLLAESGGRQLGATVVQTGGDVLHATCTNNCNNRPQSSGQVMQAALVQHCRDAPICICQVLLLTHCLIALVPQYSRPARSGSATRGQSVLGDVPSKPVTFVENGVQFRADVVVGQKTGFFLDQRDNRQRMQVCAGSVNRQRGGLSFTP